MSMNTTTRRAVYAALLLVAALSAGCATGPNANPKDPLEPMNRSISTFNDTLDDNVLKPVATGYRDFTPQLLQTGISNFFGPNRRTATQMFSGSDAVITSTQRASIAATDIGTKYSVIPAITGPLAMIYRIDGLKTTGGAKATLRLDGNTICGIYLGTIKKWNDTAIKALNPSVANLPNATINVVGRSDGSGTTFVFTSYLGKAATTAQKNCAMHSNFTSSTEANLDDAAGTFNPVQTAPGTYFAAIRTANGAAAITGKSGNGGIAPYVKATNYSISYVEASYASKYNISTAAVAAQSKRSGAKVYLQPTTATVAAALKAAATVEDPTNPSTAFVQPVYATGVNSYPIVGYSWLMFYHEYSSTSGVTLGQVQGMIAFLNWALSDGQSSMYLYKGYSPIPTSARAAAIAELHKITYNGVVVWP